MIERRRIFQAVTSAVIGGVVALAAVSPAEAHNNSVRLDSPDAPSYYSQGGVEVGHTHVWNCDRRADGWGTRTWYWLASGSMGSVGDANGSAAPCYTRAVGTGANPVVAFMVCAGPNGQDNYCTGRVAA